MAKKGSILGLGFILFATGATAFYRGLKHYSLRKAIEYTPTSKAVSAVPGLTEVVGTARVFQGTMPAPYAQVDCIYYDTEIWRWSGSGKSRHRSLEKKMQPDKPILVQDDTGTILVQPTFYPASSKSEVGLKRDATASGVPSGGAFRGLFGDQSSGDKLAQFLSRSCPSLSGYGDRVDVYETYIKDGDPIYALGEAEIYDPDEENPRLIVKDDKRTGYFCIADGTEKDALRDVSSWLKTSIFGGPVLAFLGYELAVLGLMEFGVELSAITNYLWLGLAIPVALYAWLFYTELTAIYNGLVLLKNQAGRAKANLDTFLLKRHDLIPNLVKIVQAYTKYEKGLLDGIAQLRAAPAGESGKALIAIAERYPALKANANFLSLQKELVELEDQIAGSRQYYNDAVMLYNRQIGSFPAVIAAKVAKMKPIEYAQFDG